MKRFCLVGVFAALWYGTPVTAEEATAEKLGKLIFADDFIILQTRLLLRVSRSIRFLFQNKL